MSKQEMVLNGLYEMLWNIASLTKEEFEEKFTEINEEYNKLHDVFTKKGNFITNDVNYEKTKIRNKRMRKRIERHKLQKLYEETKYKYGVGVYYSEQKKRLIKDSVNKSSVRKACNRHFRRRLNRGELDGVSNGGSYRKHEDYWWAVI